MRRNFVKINRDRLRRDYIDELLTVMVASNDHVTASRLGFLVWVCVSEEDIVFSLVFVVFRFPLIRFAIVL